MPLPARSRFQQARDRPPPQRLMAVPRTRASSARGGCASVPDRPMQCMVPTGRKRMRRMIMTLVAVLVTAPAGESLAQYYTSGRGIEIMPFAGYRWGGSLNTLRQARSFDARDNWAYGIGIGKVIPGDCEIEIQWSHFQADVDAVLLNGTPVSGGPLKRDDIMLNGTWHAYRASPTIMPFFTAGIGAALFSSPISETIGRFGW